MGIRFHMGAGHFGFQHGHPVMHGDTHGNRVHRAERGKWNERNRHYHFVHAGFGQWRRWTGFGSSTRSSSIADGQWHAGGELH